MIADDHPIIVMGLATVLADRFEVVATVTDGREVLDLVRRLQPDLLLLDFSMPGVLGLEHIRGLSRLPSAPGIVVLTMHEEPFLADAVLRAGASAFLPKSSSLESVAEALKVVGEETARRRASAAGSEAPAASRGLDRADDTSRHLTARQATVVEMYAAGHSTKRIAAQLGLSRRTVEVHKYQAMRVLSVSNTAGLVRAALLGGAAPPREDP